MPSFKIIELLVLKKIFFMIFVIYSHGGHLGDVTTMQTFIRSPEDAPNKVWPCFGFREDVRIFRSYTCI